MMRLWRDSYTKPAILLLVSSATISVAIHATLISAAVWRTQRPPELPGEGIANRVFYIPPPDRAPTLRQMGETIHYVAVSPSGFGSGLGLAPAEPAKRAAEPEPSRAAGDAVHDSIDSKALVPTTAGQDSAFSILEVDSAVVRMENSAAPAYPLALLQKGITGSVAARYVVDTTGFADTSSFQVMHATHAEFVAAVRAALPYMRFSPAKIGSKRVRQLVDQEFTFKIAAPAPGPGKKPGSDA